MKTPNNIKDFIKYYQQTERGKHHITELNIIVIGLWNDNRLSRDDLGYIGWELYRRSQEE